MMLTVIRCAWAVVVFAAMPAMAADLPKATQNVLAALKLDPSILAGLDEELAVPQEWIEAAKQEGALRMAAAGDQQHHRQLNAAFVERYPFIQPQIDRATHEGRALKTLMAFKMGRITTDMIGGLNSTYDMFARADALVDMRDLPGWKNVPDDMKDKNGLMVGMRLRYWCMAYNTDKVKKGDMPKTWDDLLTNPVWRDGNLALSNRPGGWFAPIWALDGYGETWGKPYLEKLFGDVKPQRRKEGNNAMMGLLIAGEFHAVIPSGDHRAMQYVKKGAPVAWHCPEPVPLSISGLGVLKGNPHPYAAKLWVNWFLSKEGQIAQYSADGSPPVHKDLQLEAFLPFPEQVLGRKIAFRDPVQVEENMPEVYAAWNPLWDPSGQTTGQDGDE